jgi:choline dehydrogenase-like flavoprotein
MLLSAEDLPVDRNGRTAVDVVVIGAGAAGIVLAQRLADSGRDVLVLEAGGVPPDDSHTSFFNGDNVGHPYDLVGSRYRALGGATNLWAGFCRPLDTYEMQRHPWVGGLPWPLSHAELTRYSRQAARLLDLGPWEWNAARIARAQGKSALADVPGAAAMLDSVVWRFATQPLSFAERFADFIHGPRSRIAINAPVRQLVVRGGAVRGVRVRLRTGVDRLITCQTAVLAAGGIENVRLLLETNERLRAQGERLDRSGWLGRGWQEHPHAAIATAYIPESVADDVLWLYTGRRDIDGTPVLAGLTLPERVLRARRMAAMSVTIDPQFFINAPFAQGVQAVAQSAAGEPVRPYLLFARSESRTVRGSRITLSRRRDPLGRRQVRLNWTLDQGDYRDLSRAAIAIARAFARLDLGVVRVDADRSALERRLWGGSHHIGGARMSEDPRRGVTDENGEVHGVTNLFVTGSAVFPSGGFSNPTLAIMALALRQADFLARGRRR